jgi:PIN domain nuclease of toxin-antitoxin system
LIPILYWSIGKINELSEKIIQEIKNPDNEIFVSAVSLWEIALKCSIGRLLVDFNVNKIPGIKNEYVFASKDTQMELYEDEGLELFRNFSF